MQPHLLLFAHLLIFVTGTLLYGFLSRELYRNPHVLPGLSMRLTVMCLTAWYGGCLVDQVGRELVPAPDRFAEVDALLDVLRGLLWLASFPLLTQGLWRLLEREGRRPSMFWLVPGYVTLAAFVPVGWTAWRQGSLMLTEVGRATYPMVILHVGLASAASAFMVLRWLRFSADARLNQFLRWLLAGLGITVGLVIAGGIVLPGGPEPWAGAVDLGTALWRLLVEASGLVLGLTFLYFVQRYNLLRLSMSYRSLRHFLALLGLVGLVMLVGTVAGRGEGGGPEEMRRLVAWGILAALLAAALYTPLQEAALRRFAWLRRLLGVSITAEELEALTRQLQSLDLAEEEMQNLAARGIGQWLATRARFLPRTQLPLLWEHFMDPEARAFNRLDSPTGRIAALLQSADLQAAFPLRVAGELVGVLVVEISPAAGGYQQGDMETVQLVLRQLAVSLEVRGLLEARVQAERRLAERERLSLLGLVAASLAHELKNPLSSMKALAQTVHEELEREAPGSDRAQDLGLIVEQIDRLHGVSREILDFARAPEGEGVELAALLRRTLYVLGHQARRRGIEFDVSGVQEVGRAAGTSATWQTVLFNLLLNASQHAPAGSTVAVRLERHGKGIVFATENAGPAIPEEIAGRLFEPFTTGSEEGTGLGLALVAQRVRELGGTLSVVNEAERIVFEVRLEKAAW